MADNSKMVVTMARCLAIGQIVTGSLLFCFGLVDGMLSQYDQFGVGFIFFGVWIGLWACITGGLGIPGSRRENTRSRSVFAAVFMGFSITSAVMGGIIIIFYSLEINFASYYDDSYHSREMYFGQMAISAIILVLGIAEFVIGIWAAICCCMMKPCACCITEQQQRILLNDPTGYVTQGPNGVPVAIPAQANPHVMTQGPGGIPVFLPQQASGGGEPVPVAADAPSHKLGKYVPLNEQV